jgi:hypothetical protein
VRARARSRAGVVSTSSSASTLVGCAGATVTLLALPLWYFLLYQVLVRVDASTAMWAAFWVYVPLSFVAGILFVTQRALGEAKS